jgi:hypothetical protein
MGFTSSLYFDLLAKIVRKKNHQCNPGEKVLRSYPVRVYTMVQNPVFPMLTTLTSTQKEIIHYLIAAHEKRPRGSKIAKYFRAFTGMFPRDMPFTCATRR